MATRDAFFVPVPPREFVNASDLMRWSETDQKDTVTLYRPDPDLNCKIALWQGDITRLRVDAIVAAGNDKLAGCRTRGHCIDAAIFSAAGPQLFSACAALGGCATGDAKITAGFGLPARYVLHTVGPICQHGVACHGQESELVSCYTSCLTLLCLKNLNSIAFCCISTGIFGFPKVQAARLALRSVRHWLDDRKLRQQPIPELIVFNTYLAEDFDIYKTLMPQYFPRVKGK